MSNVITLETDSNNAKPVRILIGGRGSGTGDYETQQWIFSITSFDSNRRADAKRQVTLPTTNLSTCTLTPGSDVQEGVTNNLFEWQRTSDAFFSSHGLGLSSVVGLLDRNDHKMMSVRSFSQATSSFLPMHYRPDWMGTSNEAMQCLIRRAMN